MTEVQKLEHITVEVLLERVRALQQEGFRLVQIGATALPDQLELTYCFDLKGNLQSLRLVVPSNYARVPSISSIYWCAFIYENELHDLFHLEVSNMAVDFQGKFYNTAVKYAFGTKPPAPSAKPTPAAAPQPGVATAGAN